MTAKQVDKPAWRLAGDLDNADVLGVLKAAECGRHQFVRLTDRLFVFKRTVTDGGKHQLATSDSLRG